MWVSARLALCLNSVLNRGLLREYESSCGPSFEALLSTVSIAGQAAPGTQQTGSCSFCFLRAGGGLGSGQHGHGTWTRAHVSLWSPGTGPAPGIIYLYIYIYVPIQPVSIYLYICLCWLAAGHIVLTVFVARRHVCEAAAQPEQFYTTIYVKNCQWAK